MKKEVIKTRRWTEDINRAPGKLGISVLVYEVWHGMQLLGSRKRRKNARKLAQR